MVVARRPCQKVSEMTPPASSTIRMSLYTSCASPQPARSSASFSGYQHGVLVGQGDELGLGGPVLGAAFEVRVEPSHSSGAEREARSSASTPTAARSALQRAVVADRARQESSVCSRIEPICRSSSTGSGSKVAMQIATRGAFVGVARALSRRRRRGRSPSACASGSPGRSGARGCRGSRAPSPDAPRR